VSGALLAACGEMSVITTYKSYSPAGGLPPIGFNHQFGLNPVTSRDAFELERWFFSKDVFWEVYFWTSPQKIGFVPLGDTSAVVATRHAVTSVDLTIASEDPHTLSGLLVYPGNPGPETYAEQLLQVIRALGYDKFSSARVHIYFSELYQYAILNWSRSAGYSFDVLLKESPVAGAAPLPKPTAPPPIGSHPTTKTSR